MKFSSEFIRQTIEIKKNEDHNEDFSNDEMLERRPIYEKKHISLMDELLGSAQCCILFNTTVVEPFLE